MRAFEPIGRQTVDANVLVLAEVNARYDWAGDRNATQGYDACIELFSHAQLANTQEDREWLDAIAPRIRQELDQLRHTETYVRSCLGADYYASLRSAILSRLIVNYLFIEQWDQASTLLQTEGIRSEVHGSIFLPLLQKAQQLVISGQDSAALSFLHNAHRLLPQLADQPLIELFEKLLTPLPENASDAAKEDWFASADRLTLATRGNPSLQSLYEIAQLYKFLRGIDTRQFDKAHHVLIEKELPREQHEEAIRNILSALASLVYQNRMNEAIDLYIKTESQLPRLQYKEVLADYLAITCLSSEEIALRTRGEQLLQRGAAALQRLMSIKEECPHLAPAIMQIQEAKFTFHVQKREFEEAAALLQVCHLTEAQQKGGLIALINQMEALENSQAVVALLNQAQRQHFSLAQHPVILAYSHALADLRSINTASSIDQLMTSIQSLDRLMGAMRASQLSMPTWIEELVIRQRMDVGIRCVANGDYENAHANFSDARKALEKQNLPESQEALARAHYYEKYTAGRL